MVVGPLGSLLGAMRALVDGRLTAQGNKPIVKRGIPDFFTLPAVPSLPALRLTDTSAGFGSVAQARVRLTHPSARFG